MQSFRFHPAVARWFDQTFGSPTEPQARGWPAIQSGRHVLISAPTGSGKTLAAFLASLDVLFREGMKAELPDETQVVYVSPLKALSNDIRKNLQEPLAELARDPKRFAHDLDFPPAEKIRVHDKGAHARPLGTEPRDRGEALVRGSGLEASFPQRAGPRQTAPGRSF